MRNCQECQHSPATNPRMRGKPYRETPCATCENANGRDRFAVTDPCADFPLRDWHSEPPLKDNGTPSIHWCTNHLNKLRRCGMLEEIDVHIIYLRQASPMPSNRAVAKKVGLSHVSVAKRIKKIAAMF